MSSDTTAADTFDVIIIGGGTAGSLLAARLSSYPSIQILVLEAGENRNEDANVRTPGLARNLLGNPSYDWQFQTTPEPGLNGRVIQQPRGKLWGGSSAINSHVLAYPSRGYHDAWSGLLGSGEGVVGERWDWEGVGKYYRKFQKVQEPSEEVKRDLGIECLGSEGTRSDDIDGEKRQGVGRVQASFPVTPHVLQKAWTDAVQEIGYNSLKDPVDGDVLGGSTTMNAIDAAKGERSHAGVAFLEPATKRANLVVRSSVLVEKIVFGEDKVDGKFIASGVLYNPGDRRSVLVHARREVIVCAGTYGSPKVLELSGIGQRKRLADAGIECLCDLPGVGGKMSFSFRGQKDS